MSQLEPLQVMSSSTAEPTKQPESKHPALQLPLSHVNAHAPQVSVVAPSHTNVPRFASSQHSEHDTEQSVSHAQSTSAKPRQNPFTQVSSRVQRMPSLQGVPLTRSTQSTSP